ncbi:hypothetical protein AB1Y20_009310 [Prymnesium parvum]|uniref:Uncharacterized protein n=1 Tax=Prymnesium parvum TaxID=97485 RepID=A0AB34K001_PRYPA
MEFALTPRLREALHAACAGDAPDVACLRRYLRPDATTILLDDVQLLSHALLSPLSPSSGQWVHQLLQGAAPVLPGVRQRAQPHPELAPRLERLRAAQESREYAAMVGDLACGSDTSARDAAEMATYRSQVSVGVNLIVSMATMFCVGFYAGGTAADPWGTRATMCGLGLMILTLLVEMTLFLIGASRVDAHVHQRDKIAKTGVKDRTKLSSHFPEDRPRGRGAKVSSGSKKSD